MKAVSDNIMLNNDPGRFIMHPMYVLLQEQSPMGMMRKYEIRTVDTKENPITVPEFYSDHVSQSLPCFFKNDIVDSELVKKLTTLTGDEFDQFLISKFTVSRGDLVIEPPVTFKSMAIDKGWIIRPSRTFTQEKSKPMANFLADQKTLNSRLNILYIKDLPIS